MTVSVGLIGLGAWGQKLVRSVQGRSNRIRVTAGWTRTSAKVAGFSREQGLTVHSTLEGLLADPTVEAVVSTGPAALHAEHSLAALRAGKPVLAVKPMALNGADAQALRHEARARGLVLALGYNRFFYPENVALRAMIADGGLGSVLHAVGIFATDRYLTLPRDHWALAPESVVAGVLADHPLYAMIASLGPVRTVRAIAGCRGAGLAIPDTTGALLEFASGATAQLVALGATAHDERLTFYGTAALAETQGDGRLTTRRGSAPLDTEVFAPEDAERAQLEAFADAVTGVAPFPVSVDEAVHGVVVLEAIGRSAATGMVEAV